MELYEREKDENSSQTGRQVQRMRNILVVLAMFVCTSICLGGQEIIVNGDIGESAEMMKREQEARTAARKKKEAYLEPAAKEVGGAGEGVGGVGEEAGVVGG